MSMLEQNKDNAANYLFTVGETQIARIIGKAGVYELRHKEEMTWSIRHEMVSPHEYIDRGILWSRSGHRAEFERIHNSNHLGHTTFADTTAAKAKLRRRTLHTFRSVLDSFFTQAPWHAGLYEKLRDSNLHIHECPGSTKGYVYDQTGKKTGKLFKYTDTTIARFIKRRLGISIPDHQLNELAKKLEEYRGASAKLKKSTAGIKVYTGESIRKKYESWVHEPSRHPLHSCMTHKDMPIDIYTMTDKCSLVVAKRGRNEVGRAIVWQLDCGGVAVDRIYGESSQIEQHASANGWVIKSMHRSSSSITISRAGVKRMPYMDTFTTGYLKGDDIVLTRTTPNGPHFSLQRQDGGISWNKTGSGCSCCSSDSWDRIIDVDGIFVTERLCAKCIAKRFVKCSCCGSEVDKDKAISIQLTSGTGAQSSTNASEMCTECIGKHSVMTCGCYELGRTRVGACQACEYIEKMANAEPANPAFVHAALGELNLYCVSRKQDSTEITSYWPSVTCKECLQVGVDGGSGPAKEQMEKLYGTK